MRALLLDLPGTIASLVIGVAVLLFSKVFAIQNFVLLLSFLIISVVATKYRHVEKRERGLYEHERSWQNVISNGAVPALCCAAYYFLPNPLWLGAYIGSLSAAASDKFGSELGVLSGKPISLRNFRAVRAGTSGAISALGTFMSFIGALMIALLAYLLLKFDPFTIFVIAAVGFAGGISDTLAGIAEEAGIGTKSTSNIICTIVGALLGYFFINLG